MNKATVEIDPAKAKAATAERWTVMRDDHLVSFWAARIKMPGHDPVSLTRLGELIEFETEDAANIYAQETAAKWREESARV